MFTITQIKEAQDKVRSGADFPDYIRALKRLGVIRYETFTADGHTDYYGEQGHKATVTAKHEELAIAGTADEVQFRTGLRAHQEGKTDYPGFCRDAARSGIEKWAVSMEDMTCTYFDCSGNRVWTEAIPQ